MIQIFLVLIISIKLLIECMIPTVSDAPTEQHEKIQQDLSTYFLSNCNKESYLNREFGKRLAISAISETCTKMPPTDADVTPFHPKKSHSTLDLTSSSTSVDSKRRRSTTSFKSSHTGSRPTSLISSKRGEDRKGESRPASLTSSKRGKVRIGCGIKGLSKFLRLLTYC